jgi:hypothetical protein
MVRLSSMSLSDLQNFLGDRAMAGIAIAEGEYLCGVALFNLSHIRICLLSTATCRDRQ